MEPSLWDQRKQNYETARLTPEDCRWALKEIGKLKKDKLEVMKIPRSGESRPHCLPCPYKRERFRVPLGMEYDAALHKLHGPVTRSTEGYLAWRIFANAFSEDITPKDDQANE